MAPPPWDAPDKLNMDECRSYIISKFCPPDALVKNIFIYKNKKIAPLPGQPQKFSFFSSLN